MASAWRQHGAAIRFISGKRALAVNRNRLGVIGAKRGGAAWRSKAAFGEQRAAQTSPENRCFFSKQRNSAAAIKRRYRGGRA
jgi:hypothetical protein